MERYKSVQDITTATEAGMIKAVPEDERVRARIRSAARQAVGDLERDGPPELDSLYGRASGVIDRLGLPEQFLGFAIVAVDNAYWAAEFEAVPHDRRLLLLPKCLSSSQACQGYYDSTGLHCAGCGACPIADLVGLAHRLGYEIVIAEGTSSVVMKVLEGTADALLGVACMDSLEKSFEQISELGIPHQAIPLLVDGCADTTAEFDLIRERMAAQRESSAAPSRSFLPLLRYTTGLFDPNALDELLDPFRAGKPAANSALSQTCNIHEIAREWLLRGGKRLRPFITIAAYAAGTHGADATRPDADLHALIPPPVRRLALAIEVFHKASLVHDDIEDEHRVRYGRPTLHREHGIAVAVNIGDYLIGLGYQLAAHLRSELGGDCASDIIAHLSRAHVALCHGQGAEQMWDRADLDALRPIDALQIGANKAAPAFEAALYAGLRAAAADMPQSLLRKFSTYLGEGYQVLDDLRDWDQDAAENEHAGEDTLAGRPTILRAFALNMGAADELAQMTDARAVREAPDRATARVRKLYERVGVFHKAEALYARLRQRALGLTADVESKPVADLMRFLACIVLPVRRGMRGAAD